LPARWASNQLDAQRAGNQPRDVLSVLEDWNELPLAAVIVTVAQREQQMRGTDLFLMEDVTELSVNPVIAAGGITTLSELRDLEECGV